MSPNFRIRSPKARPAAAAGDPAFTSSISAKGRAGGGGGGAWGPLLTLIEAACDCCTICFCISRDREGGKREGGKQMGPVHFEGQGGAWGGGEGGEGKALPCHREGGERVSAHVETRLPASCIGHACMLRTAAYTRARR
jgi:hypothetical protein